jgi:hypothetical protein
MNTSKHLRKQSAFRKSNEIALRRFWNLFYAFYCIYDTPVLPFQLMPLFNFLYD